MRRATYVPFSVCAHVCVCVCVCARARVCVCACVCVSGGGGGGRVRVRVREIVCVGGECVFVQGGRSGRWVTHDTLALVGGDNHR